MLKVLTAINSLLAKIARALLLSGSIIYAGDGPADVVGGGDRYGPSPTSKNLMLGNLI